MGNKRTREFKADLLQLLQTLLRDDLLFREVRGDTGAGAPLAVGHALACDPGAEAGEARGVEDSRHAGVAESGLVLLDLLELLLPWLRAALRLCLLQAGGLGLPRSGLLVLGLEFLGLRASLVQNNAVTDKANKQWETGVARIRLWRPVQLQQPRRRKPAKTGSVRAHQPVLVSL